MMTHDGYFHDGCDDGGDGCGAAVDSHAAIPPLRIALQRWGLPPEEAGRVLAHCRGIGGATWHIGQAPHEGTCEPPDVVLHLVDAGRLAGERGSAGWNAMGPVHALRRARQRGTVELAVVLGNVALLPAVRTGCWVQAGQRGLARTVALLLKTLSDCRMPGADRTDALRRLAHLDATVSLFELHAGTLDALAKVGQMLDAIVNAAVVPPLQTWLRAPVPLHAALSACLDHGTGGATAGYRLIGSDGDDTVTGLIAFPWPDLLQR